MSDSKAPQKANIIWQGSTPRSEIFNDIYYSAEDGLAESDYVFIEANNLPERFRKIDAATFTILELGFGTGLNCLLAAQHFLNQAPHNSKLEIYSCELYPLEPVSLKQALSAILPEDNPEIWQPLIANLLSGYQPEQAGWHKIELVEKRLQLHLFTGDVINFLNDLNSRQNPGFQFQAAFLDGFAPAKNPDIWQTAVLSRLGELAAPEATLATFTAAGFVRRGLEQAGFQMRKIKGFGRKAEMLCGIFPADI